MVSIFSARRAPHGRFCKRGDERGGAREGCTRGNRQQLRAGEIHAPTPPAATFRRFRMREGKREGGGPAAPRILSGGALLRFSRACSPIPWLQPLLLQTICIFFLFSNQSGRKPSTPSPSRSSWFFFRLPASTPSRSCISPDTGSSSSPLLSLCSVAFAHA
jgi:hypothetical protein